MAPRTRTRNTKVLKENVDLIRKTKVKIDGKVTKPPRKALADKTNSLSDDNASIDVSIKTSKVALKNKAANTVTDNIARPRRDRRLPNRYVENKVLSNLSNNSDDSPKNQSSVISVPDPSPVKALSKTEKAKVEELNTVTRLRRNGCQQPAKKPPTTRKPETPKKQSKNVTCSQFKTPVISVPQPSPVKALSKTEKAEVEEHNTVTRLRRNGCQQPAKDPTTKKPETPKKQGKNVSSSPFKTPSQSLDSSLVTNRPKRICRLPSKFEDHSISPNKYIPVQPCHASTPLLQKNRKSKVNDENKTKPSLEKRVTRKNKNILKEESKKPQGIDHYFSKRVNTSNDSSRLKNKISPDSNNNKDKKLLLKRVVSTKSPKKQQSPKENIKVGFAKRLQENNLSFRVFEDRKTENKDDVYEFTYDPNEEPQPQKKKRKRVVQKRPAKPKTVVIKSNYDKNVQKALETLKSKVKPSQSQNTQPTQSEAQVQKVQIQSAQQQNLPTVAKTTGKIQIIEDIIVKSAAENKSLNYTRAPPVNESAKSIHMSNYDSIHVEDIAADFATDNNDLNYSPVNSPCPKTPRNYSENAINHGYVAVNPKDPLNLQENIVNVSFFDEEPVASSSMNMSVQNPLASPWRVEFNDLPIKWQANTYVKPDMTPAVECSYINSEEVSKKKHVYTNLVAEEPLPLIEDPPTLKQTSIISFMKEVAERSLKKKRGRSISPTKSNSLFEDTAGDTSKEFGYKTPKKPKKGPPATSVVSNTSNDKSSEKSPDKESSDHIENHKNLNEVSNETSNLKENSNQSEKSPTKKSKKKDKDVTLFGFDDSENVDQENVSPIKNVQHTRARGLRSKSRVLQEINTLSGPSRAILPVPAKAKLVSSEVVEKLYDQMKSAEDPPLLPENQNCDENAANDEESSDGQSVHLFEDIELVHHMKPYRKSYGKAKKVTFRQHSSDSNTYTEVPGSRSSDEDDLCDLTFHMPNVKQKVTKKKKKANKKLLSKKEEKEVDEWAAGFNSMCEDIEDFPLVVE